MDDETSETAVRRRNQTACEACRVTKIRCQPSDQPGVCRKCLESKKECVSRTGPRTRRPRRANTGTDGTPQQTAPSAPAPNAPSSTFSIDFAVPAPQDIDDSFDILRETHENMIDTLLPEEEDDQNYSSGFLPTSTTFPTPPASTSTPSHSIEALHGKPQFNLSSAEGLLTSFRSMLYYFPCIVLSQDDTVPHLAATRPFVLLAILATASGSRTLQGNSLYDEEFRKVLGLKFVAGGERSLELLQGMLIYCAWYPFHLRPKNRQIYHYIRMAGDLIQDLELDQEPAGGLGLGSEPTVQQLDGMRAYLAYCYYVSKFVMGWRKYKNLSTDFTAWTRTCCDVLEANSVLDADHVLVTLVRLANLSSDASDAIHDRRERSEQESRLLLLGIETQSRQLRERIPPHIAAVEPVRFAILFNDIHPNSGSLFAVLRPRGTPSSFTSSSNSLPPTLPQLISLVPSLNTYLSSTLLLDHAAFISFTAVDWGRMILCIVLAFRLSLPLPECPSFDHVAARADLRLDHFLDVMSTETDLTSTTSKVDVLSASRVVMRVVKNKFTRRVEIDNAKNTMREAELGKIGGCPMLDGSLDEYFPLWDAGLTSTGMTPMAMDSLGSVPTGMAGDAQKKASQPVFHDLWATMTMSWAGEDETEAAQTGS